MYYSYNNLQYYDSNVPVSGVPGTSILLCNDIYLRRCTATSNDMESALYVWYYKDERKGVRYLYDVATHEEHNAVKVYPQLLYNGNYLLVTEVRTADNSYHYVHIDKVLLLLHERITGLKMYLHTHYAETIEFMKGVDTRNYTPITASFMEMLEVLCIAYVEKSTVTINAKHDGVPYWIYASSRVPPSLVSQRRSQTGNDYSYLGRLSDVCLEVECAPCCVLVERVDINGKATWVAMDLYDGSDKDYRERVAALKALVSSWRNHLSYGVNNAMELRVTEGVVVAHKGCSDDLLPRSTEDETIVERASILQVMSHNEEHVDGRVVYVDGNRPCKVKPLDMYTVDVMYKKVVTREGVHHVFNTSNAYVLQKLKNVAHDDNEVLNAVENDKMCVVEVSLLDGTVKRIRTDRSQANPDGVVSSIVAKYLKDEKHSAKGMWKGTNLYLTILINRTFKTYCYHCYVPQRSHLVDVGSGNGADAHVWKERHYDVLAIEPDEKRFKNLLTATRDNVQVVARRKDASQLVDTLRRLPTRYRYVTFMRSIGHVDRKHLEALLLSLNVYGVVVVVVVTSVKDEMVDATVSDVHGQMFSMKCNDSTSKVTVRYSIARKEVQYDDNIYTYKEWEHISSTTGYTMSVLRQRDYLRNVYGLDCKGVFLPCAADACIVLRSRKYPLL
jgi:hypothetical protein